MARTRTGTYERILVAEDADGEHDKRAAFEKLIITISTEFINLPRDEIDAGIVRALELIGTFAGVDRSYVFVFDPGGSTMSNTHEWTAPGVEPQIERMQDVPVEALAWSNALLRRGQVLHVPCVADLPPEAAAERKEFEQQGTRSLIALPMVAQGETIGFLGFDSVREEKEWSDAEITLLAIVRQIVVNALQRKQVEQSLQEAYHTMEQRVTERTRALSTLLQISRDIASTLDLDRLMGVVLEELREVVDYTGASILVLEEDRLDVVAYRGPLAQEEALAISFELEGAPANRAVVERQAPVLIRDVLADEPLAGGLRATAGDRLESTFAYIRSWLGVPLIVKDRVVGMLTLDHREPEAFGEADARLVLTFANQVAVAMENARLYEAEQERLEESERRRRVAEGLRDILTVLNSNRPLPEVLDFIVCQARDLLAAEASMIRRGHFDQEIVTTEASCNLPPSFEAARVTRLYRSASDRALMRREPVIIPDLGAAYAPVLAGEVPVDDVQRALVDAELESFASLLIVPIFLRDELFGSLRFYFGTAGGIDDEDVHLAMILGDHAALAIENARLREHVREAAAMEERSRLARDLHDAVTQTLFSASLVADALPRLWESNPEEGRRRLAELQELTRGALAEMRTLLLELRPSTLVDAQLGDLLRQLAESTTGRARVPVGVDVADVCDLPFDVKMAFYRIAQEALNNVAKHAAATRVDVRLECGRGGVVLSVVDEGRGFEQGSADAHSFGLSIMQERSESIGASLTIDTEPGRGTSVVVSWTRPGTAFPGSGYRGLRRGDPMPEPRTSSPETQPNGKED